MTHNSYVYRVINSKAAANVTSLRAAKSLAAKWAREGRMTDVWRMVTNAAGEPVTNVGRVYTSFPGGLNPAPHTRKTKMPTLPRISLQAAIAAANVLLPRAHDRDGHMQARAAAIVTLLHTAIMATTAATDSKLYRTADALHARAVMLERLAGVHDEYHANTADLGYALALAACRAELARAGFDVTAAA